jgi:hypothetical protein
MVLRFTAKVKKREVVVRDVDLPEGSTVDVTIAPQQADDHDFTPEQWKEIRAAFRAADRGEVIPIEESFARLRGISLYGHDYFRGRANGGARDDGMGAPPRRRKKPAARRVRKSR